VYTAKPIDRKYEYAPAVLCRRGNLLFVSGMVGWDENGQVVGSDDITVQARCAFQNLRDVLAAAGGRMEDVVMATEYVVDMREYPQIARVRREFFGDHRPAATLVEVSRLFKPDLRFEIQAIALLATEAP
jgi:enamine deaminase RidA (YjgF/YER057c/UK114 family)